MNTQQSQRHPLCGQRAGLAALILIAAAARAAVPEGRGLDIERHGTAITLHWLGILNAPYAAHARDHLGRDDWSLLDTVIGADGPTAYTVPDGDSSARFFRVLFPQPTVAAGEPALLAQTQGSTIDVNGLYYYPGDQIRVGGVLLSNTVFVNSSLLRATLPAGLPAGRYDIEIVSGRSGQVLAVLPAALESVDPTEDPYRMLLEPPGWPPAGPGASGRKGLNAVTVKRAAGYSAAAFREGRLAEVKREIETMEWNEGTSRGPVTVLKNHGVDEDCDGVARGHVTVLKNKGIDDDCDDVIDLLLHSGELQQQTADLYLPGRGLDFVWTRTYRSRTGEPTPQGNRWTHGYDVRCVVKPGETAAWIYDGTGRKDLFLRQADGTFACPGIFREGTLADGVFRLTFADTGFWTFNPQGTSPAAGKLARIQDRNGNALTLSYDGAGRLAAITDTLGRVHTVEYTPEGRIAAVTDSTGRTVSYAYYGGGSSGGNLGDLMSVTSPPVVGTPNGNDFPDGKTVSYTYTSGHADGRANHLLLTVVDALGQVPLHCDYDLDPLSPTFQRCVAFQRGAHPPACVTYMPQAASADNRYATMRCILNDAIGNVSEASFDIRNRCVAERAYTGRAVAGLPVTDAANRPTGKLRETDPNVFETTYAWNRDNRLSEACLPGGNVLAFVYQAELDALTPARKRGDCRSVRERAPTPVDVDGDGLPDVAERIRTYEYDPRFGSETVVRKGATHLCPQCPHPGFSDLTSRDDESVRNDGFTVEMAGFITSETDPRGNVTTAEYDAQGRMGRITFKAKEGATLARTYEYAYDAFGQLTAITHAPDHNGHRRVDTYAWSQGQIAQCVVDAGPGGLALTTVFEHDARGNTTRVVDPRGNDVLAVYNALNQPVSTPRQTQGATFGERVRTTFFYDANNNLVRIDRENRGPDGAFDETQPYWTTTYEYDILNRPTQIAHEAAHTLQQSMVTNQFVYDANGRLALHRLPEAVGGAEPDNIVAYAYDERGLPFSELRAPGTGLSARDVFDYDANGRLVRSRRIDAETTSQTTFAYDGFDRRVRVVDAMGNVVTRSFDLADNLVYEHTDGEIGDAPGDKGNRTLAETRHVYDDLDRRIASISAFFDVVTELAIGDGEATTTWTYAPNGLLTSVMDDNGANTAYTYDRAGRLASVVDAKGNVTSYARDACGNVLATTQTDLSDVTAGRQIYSKTFTYDALGRRITAADGAGNTVSNAYDACDNRVSVTDPLGNETSYVYDGLGRVTATLHYDGARSRGITINTTHVEYRNNRLVASVDANGNTTAYAYDACDRLTQTTHADNTAESLVWSPRSNVARYVDANGTVITNQYDLCDRLVRRDIAVAPGVMATTTFESFAYDGLGRLTSAENDMATLLYGYDALGNRVSSSQNGAVSTATFDGVGNRRTCTCPSGHGVYTSYDALNRPFAVSLQAPGEGDPAPVAMFAYDGAVRLAKITRANGINTRVFWNGAQGVTNADGDHGWHQVSKINHAQAGGGQVVDQRASLYDGNQNKILRAMTAPWNGTVNLVTNQYGYDAMHRLRHSRRSGHVVAGDFDYVCDVNGNRLQVTNNGAVEVYAMDATTPEPADFQMNQYTTTPFGAEQHDAQGNRVGRDGADEPTFYRYDYADRLVQVDTLDPVGTPVTVATYRYDALGRRIGKTVFAAGGLPPALTTYVYDDTRDDDCDGAADDRVLEVYTGAAVSSVSVLAGASGGGAASASYAATGRMLSPPVGFVDAAGELLFTHVDERGHMLALTDAAGLVVERYDYGDFGAPMFFDATGTLQAGSAVGNDVLAAGLRWDAETGLYAREVSNPLYKGKGPGVNPLYEEKSGAGNNPLYEASSSTGGSPMYDPMTGRTLSHSKGTVKFFNEAKGFGRIGGGAGTRAQDHNSSRSNGCGGRTRGQDHNSSRSNKTASLAAPDGGGGGGGTRVQDHNSSRSNKTASLAAPDGGGDSGYSPVNRIVPVALDKGLRFKTRHDTAKNSIGNIR